MEEKKQKLALDQESQEEKIPYPKSVFFIVSNEFCERFCYYGMRTILSIYLTDMLFFSEPDAKIIYHTFTMLVYFFPVFGAMLADSLLGKFRTIFYISIIYAIGNAVLALGATPSLNIPQTGISMLGLLLIAIGTGGIKPCVSAFGGDQFILPQQEKQLAMFFSMFYFSINFGSFVSTFLTPILRDQACFGSDQCFTLAFAVPGVLMVVSIVIFVCGKKLYIIREPEGNMVLKVSKCIGNALSTKSKSSEKKEHWLDYAESTYGSQLVNDIKVTLNVLVLFIPLPVFWCLFDQQGTGWTFQARRMDGDIGFYTILPDQMQVVNPILILAFIPLFQYAVYPLLDKMRILRTPLQRLVAGGVLAAVSFAISASIALLIEAENPILPEAGNGHMMLYNNLDCPINVSSSHLQSEPFSLDPMEYKHFIVKMSGSESVDYTIDSCLGSQLSSTFDLTEKENIGYYFKNQLLQNFTDDLAKDEKGFPRITFLVNSTKFYNINLLNTEGKAVLESNNSKYTHHSITKPMLYKLKIGDYISHEIDLRLGAVYNIIINVISDTDMKVEALEITEQNKIHMLWILPQYIIITAGEIMFSITGLEFSFSQAPTSMKSVLQACWLLTSAFGNLLVVIIESAEIFEEQSYNFFLYAALMLLDMGIFSLMAMRYKYVEKPTEENSEDDLQDMKLTMKGKEAMGIENPGFNEKL